MKLLEITGQRNGRRKQKVAEAMVDDALFTRLTKYPWSLQNQVYPVTKIKLPSGRERTVLLHQVVWILSGNKLPKKPFTLDHADRNKLNAQISNLREASPSLQVVNQGLSKRNKSGLKGVSWHKQRKKWRAQIEVNGSNTHLGLFPSVSLAADAYREAHQRIHGIPPVE